MNISGDNCCEIKAWNGRSFLLACCLKHVFWLGSAINYKTFKNFLKSIPSEEKLPIKKFILLTKIPKIRLDLENRKIQIGQEKLSSEFLINSGYNDEIFSANFVKSVKKWLLNLPSLATNYIIRNVCICLLQRSV